MNAALARRKLPRRDPTDAEAALWRHLRAPRFASFKFRRRHPLGPFVVGFFCPTRRLAIELDGGPEVAPRRASPRNDDVGRTSYLVARGITVMRFQKDLILREPESILAVMAAALGL
jgi:very-short-patch-repair endonuclease